MFNRIILKMKGKMAFKANYWNCVLAALLLSIITGSGAAAGFSSSFNSYSEGYQDGLSANFDGFSLGLGLVAAVIVLFFVAIALLISIFLINPFIVGINNFFVQNRRDHTTKINAVERGFKPNWLNVVKVQFVTNVIIFLFTCLLIIPGIIKSYEYRLVPYILAENPNIDSSKARLISKKLMYGSKWSTFVLDLSFIGWFILGGLTCGLLNLFYVMPYAEATYAELYIALAHPKESEGVGVADPTAKTVEFETTQN